MKQITTLLIVLVLAYSSSTYAAVIHIDGSFYQKSVTALSNDASGAEVFDQVDEAIDYVPGTLMQTFSFNPNTPTNQAVMVESGSFANMDSSGIWNRAVFQAEMLQPITGFTDSLLSMVDFSKYSQIFTRVELYAGNGEYLNLIDNTTTLDQSITVSYTINGFSETFGPNPNQYASTSFTYYNNTSLNLPRPASIDDLFAVDGQTTLSKLLRHAGKFATISEGIGFDDYASDGLGNFVSSGHRVSYLGDGILSVSVSEPSTVILSLLGVMLLVRRRPV